MSLANSNLNLSIELGLCYSCREYDHNDKFLEKGGGSLVLAVDYDSNIPLQDEKHSSASDERIPPRRYQKPTCLSEKDGRTKKKIRLDSTVRDK